MRHLAMTGNIDGGHDLANHFRRGHARHSAFGANLCWDALQRHDGYCSGALGDLGLLGVVTSMITPPFSISARPVFRRRLVLWPLFCDIGLLSSASLNGEFSVRPKRSRGCERAPVMPRLSLPCFILHARLMIHGTPV